MSIRLCYDEGVLRSFLDDALPAAERTVSAAAKESGPARWAVWSSPPWR